MRDRKNCDKCTGTFKPRYKRNKMPRYYCDKCGRRYKAFYIVNGTEYPNHN